MPFQLGSLLFVALSSLAFTLLTTFGGAIAVLAILGIYILLAWLNRYAFAILDAVANGEAEVPIASVEILGPFGDARAWVHPLLGVGVWVLLTFAPGIMPAPVLIAAALLFPLSVSAIAVSHRILDAVNPLAWWQILRGLGLYYLLLLCACVIAVGSCLLVTRLPLWRGIGFAVFDLLALCLYSLIGGVVHARRQQLGFEPRRSPERKADMQAADRLLHRQRMIDAVYVPVRVGDFNRVAEPLRLWFSSVEPRYLQSDVEAVLAQACLWPERRGLVTVARSLVSFLIESKQTPLAVQVAESTLKLLPDIALGSEAETITLARLALLTGQRRLALLILDSLQRAAPNQPQSDVALALRRQLTPP